MAETFGRAYLGPNSYEANTWTILHQVKSSIVGALVFDFSISNTSSTKITVECQLEDKDGNMLHYILGPTELQNQGIAWDTSHKIVMQPGDRLMVKASAKGICFYASLVSGLKIV